jgi:drug/metabolite transporter (DMT)-like permease
MASGLLSVIFSTASLINVLLVSLIFKEKPSLRVILGVFIGLFGLIVLFGPKIFAANTGSNIQLGVLLAFLGTCSFCTGNMLSSASQRRGVPVLTATAWAMAYGTCYLTMFALVSGTKWTIDLSPTYIGSLLFLAVFASVIAFASYLTLLGRIGPAKAAYATVTFPAVALTLSAFLEDYQFTLYGLCGIALVLFGNMLVLRKAGKGKGVVQKTV